MENNKIDWEELKQKVENDLQDEIDEETQIVRDIEYREGIGPGIIYLTPQTKFKNELKNLWAPETATEEDEDYDDEGGELPELSDKEISNIAWNRSLTNNQNRNPFWGPAALPKDQLDSELLQLQKQFKDYIDPKYDGCTCEEPTKELKCKHFDEVERTSEYYIYPLTEDTELRLCCDCNKLLTKEIIDQIVMEAEL